MELSNNDARWIKDFRKKHGRSPVVLHIGNVANNAYNNVKLLNEAGLDCDLICHDFYHVGGCPEWEDADFSGDIGDEFYPDWWSVDLRGFKRPRWFAQGPLDICVYYLLARRRRNWPLAWAYWKELEKARRAICLGKGEPAHLPSEAGGGGASNSLLDRVIKRLIPLWSVTRAVDPLPRVGHGAVPGFDRQMERLRERYLELFPDRGDVLTPEDLGPYRHSDMFWRKLMECYDLVVAYATLTAFPLAYGYRPYVAYEHGTIRDIPFQNDAQGRCTLLGFAEAEAMYMTNADSMRQAKYIRKESGQIVKGLHGFDERRIDRRLKSARGNGFDPRFGVPAETKLFFAPARQHWRDGYASWLKGNDRLIRATRSLADRFPGKFRVALAEWGKEVQLSRDIVRELELDPYVVWIRVLPKTHLWLAFQHADCVVDQFVLSSMGGIAMEAIAVGAAPVITALDDKVMTDYYGETIPLFNCRTEDQILDAMTVVMTDRTRCSEISAACKDWMRRHHLHTHVVATQIAAFRAAGLE